MLPEQMHIKTLLHTLEVRLLSGGRQAEGEQIGLIASRLSHSRNFDRALERLYSVGGWDVMAVRLMWYAEQMRKSAVGTAPNDDLVEHRVSELAAAIPAVSQKGDQPVPVVAEAGRVDMRDALFRFGAGLEGLRRASFAGGMFSGLPEAALERVVNEAASLGRLASAQQSRDIIRFAHAFTHFATFVLEQGILNDVKVLQVISTANLTLQTVLETAEAEDFDSLYQIIELLENPRTLLQAKEQTSSLNTERSRTDNG